MCYSRGDLVQLLVSSNVARFHGCCAFESYRQTIDRYLEFKAVQGTYMHTGVAAREVSIVHNSILHQY